MTLTFELDSDNTPKVISFVQRLLSGHTDKHTYRTNCFTWTTKVVGDNLGIFYELKLRALTNCRHQSCLRFVHTGCVALRCGAVQCRTALQGTARQHTVPHRNTFGVKEGSL